MNLHHEQQLLIANDLTLTPPLRYASNVNDHSDRALFPLCAFLCNIKGKLQCISITFLVVIETRSRITFLM